MSPEQVSLVRATWKQVVPVADTAARLFYDRLFALDPGLRSLFARTDMDGQRQKLLQALGAVVGSLDRLHLLGPTLAELGRRHAAYGVEDQHYELVGAALLGTLKQGLGSAFTPAAGEAWAAAYAAVAGIMRAGAAGEHQAA